jgi:hypothetical protein
MRSITFLLLGLGLAASPAAAEVVSATPGGFEVRSQTVVAATPEEAWAMLGKIGQWWNPSHSYSGNASNLSLELAAGGCFCEHLPATTVTEKGRKVSRPAGVVEHGRVLMSMPGLGIILDSGLGPVLEEAAVGRLKWGLRAVEGGTEVTQVYIVGGYLRDGGAEMAPRVDKVLAEALERFKARVAKGR